MKKLFLFAVLAPMFALFAEGVGGTYTVAGKNPGAGRYEGTCVISGDASTGYTFQWTIGEQQFSGTGTLDGDTMTVDWRQPDPVVYKVSADGAELKGKWGPNGKGREKLTRQ
ncbi:MAG TPA: fibronectin-binding protein [Turneriella sp.]|nr:fibronectin-binding protein [Turneriella sp.]